MSTRGRDESEQIRASIQSHRDALALTRVSQGVPLEITRRNCKRHTDELVKIFNNYASSKNILFSSKRTWQRRDLLSAWVSIFSLIRK